MALGSQGFSKNNRKAKYMLIFNYKKFFIETIREGFVIQLGFYLVLVINKGYTGADKRLVSFFTGFMLLNTLTQ